jgi:hypothetical protein
MMTVAELIEVLEGYNPDSEVRLASQPKWPFEYSVSNVVSAMSDENDGDHDPDVLAVVYIAEGTQIDYLNGDAIELLGW